MKLLLGLLIAFPTFAFSEAIQIEGLDRLGIKYQAERQQFQPRNTEADAPARDVEDNHVLRITLQDLSRVQYDLLTQSLPGRPAFAKGRKYDLAEFLTAPMRALIGKQFRPSKSKVQWPNVEPLMDGTKHFFEMRDLEVLHALQPEAVTQINCWTTAYEVLRTWITGALEIDLLLLSRFTADDLLLGEKPESVTRPIDHANSFGDLILFRSLYPDVEEMILQHVAVFVLPGLYFEKTNAEQDDAFRFVIENELIAKMKRVLGATTKVSYSRLKEPVRLPRLRITESLSAKPEIYGGIFSKEDLDSLSLQADWMGRSIWVSPYRIQTIRISSDGLLDRESSAFGGFQEPKF
jgi:hypothetical protein